jgi:hypothetical protein
MGKKKRSKKQFEVETMMRDHTRDFAFHGGNHKAKDMHLLLIQA